MSAESVWRCVVIGAIIGALVTRGAVEVLTGNRLHPAVISFVVLPVLGGTSVPRFLRFFR